LAGDTEHRRDPVDAHVLGAQGRGLLAAPGVTRGGQAAEDRADPLHDQRPALAADDLLPGQPGTAGGQQGLRAGAGLLQLAGAGLELGDQRAKGADGLFLGRDARVCHSADSSVTLGRQAGCLPGSVIIIVLPNHVRPWP